PEESDDRKQDKKASLPDVADFGLLAHALLEDESSRPPKGQYVYGHFLTTHHPIGARNADCSRNRAHEATYFDHVVCATRMIVSFLEELKKMGRFEDSMIIIQSDHGDGDYGSPDEEKLPSHVASRIREKSLHDPRQIVNKTHALLLIKLPGWTAGTRLRISESPVMLVDIPATVFDALGIYQPTEQGRPAFTIYEWEQREIHMFTGFFRPEVIGQLTNMSRDRKGELCHFSLTERKGWKLYPNIPFTRD
ncbi:MAG: sulfatase-like hydrolase/transferase, partial [Desulfomonilaceae bacterium]|nr:sulfatase-like hydrolase/transferase [Desulfomonilaceae bacterium]